jgi:hypothetical protein
MLDRGMVSGGNRVIARASAWRANERKVGGKRRRVQVQVMGSGSASRTAAD